HAGSVVELVGRLTEAQVKRFFLQRDQFVTKLVRSLGPHFLGAHSPILFTFTRRPLSVVLQGYLEPDGSMTTARVPKLGIVGCVQLPEPGRKSKRKMPYFIE